MQEPFGGHGQYEVAWPAGLGGQQGVQAEALDGAQDRLDVVMGEVALDGESLGGGEELLAGQGATDEVDEFGREVGDVAEGFVLDQGADAEGAAGEAGLMQSLPL
jgi:hypothetical protein